MIVFYLSFLQPPETSQIKQLINKTLQEVRQIEFNKLYYDLKAFCSDFFVVRQFVFFLKIFISLFFKKNMQINFI